MTTSFERASAPRSGGIPARAHMSIGEVLRKLRPDFPDVTLSKIRFLEAEGLVEPQRTPSGYRTFTHDDLQRLRYVLAAQRDRYLPLKVIREHLDAIDRGLEPPDAVGEAPRVPISVVRSDGVPGPEMFTRDASELRLSRTELLEAAGATPALLSELESYGLVAARGSHYDGDALLVTRAAAELSGYGLEPRHLRAYKTAADREVGLIDQVVAPLRRQTSAEAEARLEETVRELAALSVRLHAGLVKSGLSHR
jgi:DNA-binding transcriptional MerR regulator